MTPESPILPESDPKSVSKKLLAQELGIGQSCFPDEYYQEAERIVLRVYHEIAPHIVGLDAHQMGEYFWKEREKIFAIFDSSQQSWRLPLLLRDGVLTGHAFLAAAQHNMNEVESYNAFLYCMHFYLYLNVFRKLRRLCIKYPQGMLILELPKIVEDEMTHELEAAWGIRSGEFFIELFTPDRAKQVVAEISGPEQGFKINSIHSEEYRRLKRQFWERADLAPERLLHNAPKITGEVDNHQSRAKYGELDAPALSFFLCQKDLFWYEALTDRIFKHSDHHSTWQAWISEHIHLLKRCDSETFTVFTTLFGINGDLFNFTGQLSRIAKKKLPPVLQDAILKADLDLRAKIREERRRQKPSKTVAKIPTPTPPHTAMSALLARPEQPTKIIVPALDIKSVLPDFETSKSVNKQLTQIDFSGCDFPEGAVVTVERALPSKKKDVFEVVEGIDPRGKNTIEPVLGKDIQGQFAYKITIVLPSTHRFEGGNVFKVSYYAKAEPTPAEIEAERVQREALKNQSKVLPETVAAAVEEMVEKVESIINPVANSLIAATLVLVEKQKLYAVQEGYQGGPITITLSDADCVEVLGDESITLLSEHKHWTVNEDDSINPVVDDADVKEALFTIAEKIRENYRLKQEQEEQEIREKQEIAEYETQRKNFEPILEFARNFKFEGREKGNFEQQKATLREELKSLGWSIPVVWAENQVVWRHIQGYIKILYTSKMCTNYDVQAEAKGFLTPTIKKCYEEVAEAFAHIARFFNAETRERKKMITREQSMRKEVENSAVSYDALLEKGQARLVLFGPYQQSHGAWSSKFPTEKTPHMLDERASRTTIDGLLEQYPTAELCYRRDLLCINGEIADNASQESIENTSLNITELRHSPRARYILRKRILITLKLEKFSDETDRAPIKHEKNKREGSVSALDILLRMKDKKAVQTSSDITEEFISGYIDELEKNKIRVHYVWPLSSRLDEHQTRMRKHAAKIAVAEEAKTTAD